MKTKLLIICLLIFLSSCSEQQTSDYSNSQGAELDGKMIVCEFSKIMNFLFTERFGLSSYYNVIGYKFTDGIVTSTYVSKDGIIKENLPVYGRGFRTYYANQDFISWSASYRLNRKTLKLSWNQMEEIAICEVVNQKDFLSTFTLIRLKTLKRIKKSSKKNKI